MVISDEHKYVFVELPLTGTSAISTELCRSYDGRRILNKHSTYRTYLRQASDEERKYFAFSCIRDPMDAVVSQYFKLKSDHFDFENPEKLAKRTWLNRLVYSRRRLEQIRFIRDNHADFATYFMRFYRTPYSNWAILSHHKLDFVIRFENLSEDFALALSKVGLKMLDLLPVRNSTRERSRDFLSYYTDDTIERSKRVFSPFMAEWGYGFPNSWGDTHITTALQVEYAILNSVRKFYWNYLKHDP